MRLAAIIVVALAATFSTSVACADSNRALPGNYFASVAAFYLEKKDYHTAIEMFELASFWANKVAQYNVGVLYFNGIGNIPADRIRGTAWLGIAAEQHGDLAQGALQSAYEKLTSDEKIAADKLFAELDKKYGDTVALRRATRKYEEERRSVTGSRLGVVGNITIQYPDGTRGNGESFYKLLDKQFADYLDSQFGHVDIGSVIPLPMPNDAAARTSPVAPTEAKP